jgi:ribose transport system ATP-binding protein
MISEDRRLDGYFSRLSIGENISITDLRRFWKRGRLDRGAERREIAELMREFQVVPPDPDRRMADFSGGNQQKAIIAKWVRLKPDLLICDEPVVGVDIGSKIDIYRILEGTAAAGATVLLMSTEFKDLAGLCDRVIVLNKGRIVGDLSGAQLTEDRIARLAYAS